MFSSHQEQQRAQANVDFIRQHQTVAEYQFAQADEVLTDQWPLQ